MGLDGKSSENAKELIKVHEQKQQTFVGERMKCDENDSGKFIFYNI